MRALVVLALTLVALAAVPQRLLAQQGPVSDALGVAESDVAIIDSAQPRNMLRLRLDLGYDNIRPTRAEYFLAKGGLPFTPGLPLPETKIQSYQDASAYAEFAPVSFFSVFLETPMRWLNPEVNANTYGYGDMNFGFKLATWNTPELLATLQLRFYQPTGGTGLGTGHWTIEPALLASWRPYTNIELEGEVRYWVPLGGTDFAGDVLRYGAGLSFGDAQQGIWYKPVIEAVGWTVLGGKEMAVSSPDAFVIQSAAGQTIFNGYLGLRVGMGATLDVYAGYGRCFTGNAWARDFVRMEMRFFY
jgi:hypothetical protein